MNTQKTPIPKIDRAKVVYPQLPPNGNYKLVTFPEIQDFMLHPRFGECIFCVEIVGHPCPDSTYAVPEDLYNEVLCLTKN